MLSDIEIAQQNRMEKIQVIANKCGLTPVSYTHLIGKFI